MGKRKAIPWKTKYAAALLALGHIPYDDAKQMTEDQIISLYHVDHNILHETEDPNRDLFWNLTPMLIRPHREKTKTDAKIVAKSRRIRKKLDEQAHQIAYFLNADGVHRVTPHGTENMTTKGFTIRSRGFDKTKTRGFDGKVRNRKRSLGD